MRSLFIRFDREIAFYLILFLAAPSLAHAGGPSVSQAATQEVAPQPLAAPPVAPAQTAAPEIQKPTQAQKPDVQVPAATSQVPVGTAAAPVIRSEGNPASRPAGAAIAPAKQRRTRSYALRIGLIIGAAVAIGVVTAASLSSSSRPH